MSTKVKSGPFNSIRLSDIASAPWTPGCDPVSVRALWRDRQATARYFDENPDAVHEAIWPQPLAAQTVLRMAGHLSRARGTYLTAARIHRATGLVERFTGTELLAPEALRDPWSVRRGEQRLFDLFARIHHEGGAVFADSFLIEVALRIEHWSLPQRIDGPATPQVVRIAVEQAASDAARS